MASKKTVIVMAGILGLLSCPNNTSQQVPVIDPAMLEQRVQDSISADFLKAANFFQGKYLGMIRGASVFENCFYTKRAGEVQRFSTMNGFMGDYLVKVKDARADLEKRKSYFVGLGPDGKIIAYYESTEKNKDVVNKAMNDYWKEKH